MIRLLCVAAVIGGWAGQSFGQETYQDPDGLFSVTAPAGWRVTPLGKDPHNISIARGYVRADLVTKPSGTDDGAAINAIVAEWRRPLSNARQAEPQEETLGGVRGASAIITGERAPGAPVVLKVVAISTGERIFVLGMSAPASELAGVKGAFDQIQLSFRLGGRAPAPTLGGRASAAAARAPVPAPAANHLPPGFKIAGPAEPTTQALYKKLPRSVSAREAFLEVRRDISGYFDRGIEITYAWTDATEAQVNALFAARFHNNAVQGLLTTAVAEGEGYATVLFDRPDSFAQFLPDLVKRLTDALEKEGGAPPQRRSAPVRAPAQLTPYTAPDGTQIGLPPGWQVAQAGQGTVIAHKPGQAIARLGETILVAQPGTWPHQYVAPYGDPASALYVLMDQGLSQRDLSSHRATLRILEQRPVSFPNGQAAFLVFETDVNSMPAKGVALIITQMGGPDRWTLYSSYVACLRERFDEEFPSMWAMWRSWSVSDATLNARLDGAAQNMREISRIINRAYETRNQTMSRVSQGWSEAMRGVTTVEDTLTGRRGEVDLRHIDEVLRHDNRYREVPLGELNP